MHSWSRASPLWDLWEEHVVGEDGAAWGVRLSWAATDGGRTTVADPRHLPPLPAASCLPSSSFLRSLPPVLDLSCCCCFLLLHLQLFTLLLPFPLSTHVLFLLLTSSIITISSSSPSLYLDPFGFPYYYSDSSLKFFLVRPAIHVWRQSLAFCYLLSLFVVFSGVFLLSRIFKPLSCCLLLLSLGLLKFR